MTDAWFSFEVPRALAFLSLLSLLAIPASRGQYKTAVMAIWITVASVGGALVVFAIVAALVGQPWHVVRTLGLLGLVFGVTFGCTLPALRRVYREAELRKTIALDL